MRVLPFVIIYLSALVRAAAQAPAAPQGAGESLWPPNVAQQLEAAAKLKVRTDGGRFVVAGARVAPASLTFSRMLWGPRGRAPTPGASSVSFAEIHELQIPAGTHAKDGALIGAGLGVLLVATAVIVTAGDDWVAPSGGQIAAASLVYPAAGAGLGALIGSLSTRWRTVYRATSAL